jgi:hypothetical protein
LEVRSPSGKRDHNAKTYQRWFYWLMAIFSGLGCLLAFFCLPETRYNRSPMSFKGQVVHTDEFGVTRILSDDEAREFGAYNRDNDINTNSTQKRTFVQTLNPVSPVAPHGFRLAGAVLLKMLSALSSPAVIWAILASSISLGTSCQSRLSCSHISLTHLRCRHFHVVDLRDFVD